jgi:acylglycerol lipase
MGGGTSLTYGLSGSLRSKLAGVVAWGPMLQLSPETAPNSWFLAAGKVVAKFMGKKKMVNQLEPSYMCRDPVVCQEFIEDRLCHDTGTLEGIAAMFDRGEVLMREETQARFDVGRPVLVCHGTGDRLTDPTASERFFKGLRVEDKTHLKYEGWYHKCEFLPASLRGLVGDWADFCG